MAITQETFNGDGSNLGPFSFTFKWLRASDIKVSVNNVLKTAGTHYNLQALNYTTKTGGQVLFTAGNAPPVGTANIRVYRETDDTSLVATFSSGSSIRAADLNSNFTQELYKVQEVTNYSVQDVGDVTLTANYTFTYSPSAPTPTQNSHLATKAYVDGVAFAAGNLTVGDKGDITVNSATSWSINNNSVITAKIADGAVTGQKLSQSYLPLSGGTMTAPVVFSSDQLYPKVAQNSKTSAYTLVASDAGKHISITTGGVTVPVDIFSSGDVICVYNNSGSNQTITQASGTTVRQAGTANTGNRTLAQYGVATILCVATNTFVISGAGLS